MSIGILMSSMKSVILLLIVAVALIVPARVITCPYNPYRCKAGECCVESGNTRKCRPLQERGGMCNPRDNKSLNGVYQKRCPCSEGLTCGSDYLETIQRRGDWGGMGYRGRTGYGIHLFTASGAREARQIFTSLSYMQDVDGLEFVNSLRQILAINSVSYLENFEARCASDALLRNKDPFAILIYN